MINAVDVQRRTVDQVKFKWGSLKQSAKKSFSAARKQSKLTGGGPPPKPPTAAEEKMKDRPNFSGTVGGVESSMPVPPSMIQCGFFHRSINKLIQILKKKTNYLFYLKIQPIMENLWFVYIVYYHHTN